MQLLTQTSVNERVEKIQKNFSGLYCLEAFIVVVVVAVCVGQLVSPTPAK